MFRNRRFMVQLNSEKSRWRNCVLAPILFNTYTNDQPKTTNTERFLYADDLALATRTKIFQDAESNLGLVLDTLSKY